VYSKGHALVAGGAGVPVVLLASDPLQATVAWAWVVALGVGIDADHFAIARLNRGDWTNLRRVVAAPRLALAGQDDIFDPGDVWRDQRLLSHLVVGGVLTVAAWLLDPFWALATGASVYTHVVADLVSDARTRAEYVRESAPHVDR
jgi:hypothetical protein